MAGFWKKFAVRAQTATLMMAAFVSIARSRGVALCFSRAARVARGRRAGRSEGTGLRRFH